MRLAIFSITSGGKALAARLANKLNAELIEQKESGITAAVKKAWGEYDGFLMVMAAGIVVRTIAPLIKDKKHDPCVVIIDQAGKFAVSLLSGHLGGGNYLARRAAEALGGQAVITTASDTLGLTALDLWASHNNLKLDQGDLTRSSSILVNSGQLKVFSDLDSNLPEDFKVVPEIENAELVISNRLFTNSLKTTTLRPPNLIIGIGCNRGTSAEQIENAVSQSLNSNGLSRSSLAGLASIDLKSDEQGLLFFAKKSKLSIAFYSAEELNAVCGPSRSEVVFKATGAYAVAEPAARLSAQTDKLLIRKIKWKDITIAIAEKSLALSANYQ